MNVRIDETRCQGHGLCNFAAPELFRLRDEDGHAEVEDGTLTPELEDAARRAALGCPEQAIIIEE
ncbi:MAG TPA: ferredoxin [Acidimicrobiia bacterium]